MNYAIYVIAKRDFLRKKDGHVSTFWTISSANDEMARQHLVGPDNYKPQTAYVCNAPVSVSKEI